MAEYTLPKDAVRAPIGEAGAEIGENARSEIADRTQGYPCCLQEWAAHSWKAAPGLSVTLKKVVSARGTAVAALDASLFRVRVDRLTPREHNHLRAMADPSPAPFRGERRSWVWR